MTHIEKVVIVGAGGFGREVLEIFKAQNNLEKKWEILGFIDDFKAKHKPQINGFPVLGGTEWFLEQKNDVNCVVAIGDPRVKKNIVLKLEKSGVNFCNAIHPSVITSEFIDFGQDVIICAGCILTVNIRIGNHVIININSTVGHDAIIEDYCSIMPTCKINGNNHLHKGIYVGTGATFIHQISVGAWSTIGAGSVVTKNIPENVVAVGIPAKVIKRQSS